MRDDMSAPGFLNIGNRRPSPAVGAGLRFNRMRKPCAMPPEGARCRFVTGK
ncbi:hypothetical protein STAQ_14420 [Allostella sp. ATCC 35155]|nr:hypothetical protein STAQ_14420 [Stella sp. ATCC 35155]